MSLRELKNSESPFLKELVYEALFVPEEQDPYPRSILDLPEISKYYKNWGSLPSDLAIVFVNGEDILGAVWGRCFRPPNVGYGFLDEETPEISLAIFKEYRNKGIGTALMAAIIETYRKQNVKAVSLSVQKINKAHKLYRRLGFEQVLENKEDYIMRKSLLD